MLALCVLVLSGLPVDPRAGESPLTTLTLSPAGEGLTVSWRDTEEVLHGRLEPAVVHAEQPVTVAVSIEPYTEGRLEGPITFSLRPLSQQGGAAEVTVPAPKAGDRVWTAQLTPTTTGPHRLELAWTSTHRKAVRAVIEVEDAALPRWLPPALGGGSILVAVAFGAWLVLRRGVKP